MAPYRRVYRILESIRVTSRILLALAVGLGVESLCAPDGPLGATTFRRLVEIPLLWEVLGLFGAEEVAGLGRHTGNG
jgi:hypothetical protein